MARSNDAGIILKIKAIFLDADMKLIIPLSRQANSVIDGRFRNKMAIALKDMRLKLAHLLMDTAISTQSGSLVCWDCVGNKYVSQP